MKKKIIILIISIIVLTTSIYIFKSKDKKENLVPEIMLSGPTVVTTNFGEPYQEDGYKATYNNQDITDKVKITSNINYNKAGIYQITYEVKKNNMKAEATRFIKVNEKIYYKTEYDKIDNTSIGWWAKNNFDHNRPLGAANINELKKYNAYYLGENEKVIYLTFDEGSNDTYVEEIVDILNKYNVKGTFFLCERYMTSHKNLIKHMIDTGHLIGNHTSNHKNMPSLATKSTFNEYLNEIQRFEKAYKKITGKEFTKIYRQPCGEWSYRDLQIMKDLGYKTYFYSAYFRDYEENLSKETALEEMLKRYHNGAIYLLHPKNQGNYQALGDFISKMQKLGFSFKLVNEIK